MALLDELGGISPELAEVVQRFRLEKFPAEQVSAFFDAPIWEAVKKMTKERLQGIWYDLERGPLDIIEIAKLRGEALTCRFILQLPKLLVKEETDVSSRNKD